MTLKQDLKKPSIIWLISSNLLLLITALVSGWKLYDVLIVFWLEIMIVGFVNVLKMIKYPRSAKWHPLVHFFIKVMGIQLFVILYIGFAAATGFAIDGAFSYGDLSTNGSIFDFHIHDSVSFAIGALVITVSHLYSFKVNYLGKQEYNKVSFKQLLIRPFKRLLLVWIAIIGGALLLIKFGTESIYLLIPYFLAKILIDMRQHIVEHR